MSLIAAAQILGYLSASTLEESKEAMQNYKVIYYPYFDLEKQLMQQNKSSILIFTFGSLLDLCSASKTFSNEALITRQPAIAIGTKRVFNRDVPIKPHNKWGSPLHPKSRAMLNITFTGNDNDITNGLLMNVPIKDIASMRMREHGYELFPLIVAKWNDYLTNEKPDYFIAYTFHARDHTPYTSDGIFPRPGYYELARDAAKKQGPLFYQMWLKSTYLSDKSTPIFFWEEAVKSGHQKTLIIEKECINH